MRKCKYSTECGLSGNIVKGVSASSDEPVLFLIGEAPGKDEDAAGVPFVGKSGQELDMYLSRFTKVDRRHCHITNVVKCRPPDNRDPKVDEIKCCSNHYLNHELEDIQPAIIGTIGRFATQFLLGKVTMEKVHGIPVYFGDTIIVPLYHPAVGLRSSRTMRHIINDFTILGEVARRTTVPRKEEYLEVDYKLL